MITVRHALCFLFHLVCILHPLDYPTYQNKKRLFRKNQSLEFPLNSFCPFFSHCKVHSRQFLLISPLHFWVLLNPSSYSAGHSSITASSSSLMLLILSAFVIFLSPSSSNFRTYAYQSYQSHLYICISFA